MSKLDWEAIEREYRAGQLSVTEIARRHGTKESTVRMRAKRNGWERDLSQQVRQRVRDKTVRQDVRPHYAQEPSPERDAEIVEQAAERGAAVIDLHREDIKQGRQLVGKMFKELTEEHDNRESLGELIEGHVKSQDMDQAQANAARRAISLPNRAQTMRDLSQSLQRLVGLERQAYSLDEEDESAAPGGLADALQRAKKRAKVQEQNDGGEEEG